MSCFGIRNHLVDVFEDVVFAFRALSFDVLGLSFGVLGCTQDFAVR